MIDAPRAALLRDLAADLGTPVYVYDAARIRDQVESLRRFDIIRYAQKACSNTAILRLIRDAGALVDCVSLGELERALVAGYRPGGDPAEIVYTADILTEQVIDRVVELNVPVNAGSIDMLSQIGRRRPGHPVWLRLNPGFGHGHNKKVNTGGESSKHGIWYTDLPLALRAVDEHRLDLVGIHMHIGSGTDFEHLSKVCDAMIEQVSAAGRDLRAVSAGGGLPIPYRPGETGVSIDRYFELWDAARRAIEGRLGHRVQLEVEPGRYLVAQAGVLLAEVRAVKQMGGNHFTLVDAGFNDLVRPAMYGAYHEISLLRRDAARAAAAADERPRPTVVAGPLCESGDVFTQGGSGDVEARPLPPAEVGDYLVFHDAGAYGASMSSNYNSRPLPPEVLVEGGAARLVRRRQRTDELLALEQNLPALAEEPSAELATDAESFPVASRNRVRRMPARARYDRATVHAILDAARICHVGLVDGGHPVVIPTIFARRDDTVYLHGATTSRLLTSLEGGAPVCITVTHIDGLVLARSAFHHSMNYRSAVLFGAGQLVTSEAERLEAMRLVAEQVLAGRWSEVRLPNAKELRATKIIKVEIVHGSAKIRTGGPMDEEEDYALAVWAGQVPITPTYGAPVPDPRLAAGTPPSPSVAALQDRARGSTS